MNDSIVHLIDVGARAGLAKRWNPFLKQIRALGFEPDPVECTRLNAQKSAVRYLPTALGEHDGESATLHITSQPGCSSILRPNRSLLRHYPYGAQMEVTKTIPVTLERMDTVCQREGFVPDVIKIDTQGSELAILKGAGALLKNVIAVETEVEFIPMYEGQPLFSDMDLWMREQGFQLRGLRRVFWRRNGTHNSARGGQIAHGDALWIRPELIGSDKSLVILSAYGQDDLVAPLIQDRSDLRHLIPTPPRLIPGLLRRCFGSDQNYRLRIWANRQQLADTTDWHDADFF
jgi:FkbM family methyltransferase